MKVFNRAIKLGGISQKINGVSIKVLEYDSNGKVLFATGTTVPTDASSGYAKGAIFIKTDASTGVSGVYENLGTTTSSLFSNAFGYVTGNGGAVTQATSSSTGVTLNKLSGQITTVALTTAAAAEEVFTVTNSEVAATDVVVVSTTYAGAGTPVVSVKKTVAGAFDIVITNLHAADALDAAVVINFAVVKAVAA